MKVCIASMAPFVGGAEVSAERLAVALRGAGCEVFLLLGNRGAVMERLERAGLRCAYSPMYLTDKWHWWRYLRARRALRRLLEVERPDVVHSNDLPTHQMVSGAARGLPAPRICHHRFTYGGAAIDWFNKYGAERHLFISRALMDELCANSARLRASSRAVIHNGVPLPPRPGAEQRRAARERLGLPRDGLVVTYSGRVVATKGVADLLQAWSRLEPPWRERAELVVVGEDLRGQGRYRREMEALGAALGCAARFVGFREDVGEWLLASDIGVVPSHVEPLGNAVLEAMAYGLPVIGCAVGGIPELVVHEQTGLLVPPRSPERLAAALSRCLGDEALRRRLGDLGRQRCEAHFSLPAQAGLVLREYERLLQT
ncbi:MAG TPA: glycosyltransferase family 4 protein [Vicinamibacteria bacterium]|nr:glycosyltransferase family 4 protein [Vicinamibacteria bacterium]